MLIRKFYHLKSFLTQSPINELLPDGTEYFFTQLEKFFYHLGNESQNSYLEALETLFAFLQTNPAFFAELTFILDNMRVIDIADTTQFISAKEFCTFFSGTSFSSFLTEAKKQKEQGYLPCCDNVL